MHMFLILPKHYNRFQILDGEQSIAIQACLSQKPLNLEFYLSIDKKQKHIIIMMFINAVIMMHYIITWYIHQNLAKYYLNIEFLLDVFLSRITNRNHYEVQY